jgi:hypothetical protein
MLKRNTRPQSDARRRVVVGKQKRLTLDFARSETGREKPFWPWLSTVGLLISAAGRPPKASSINRVRVTLRRMDVPSPRSGWEWSTSMRSWHQPRRRMRDHANRHAGAGMLDACDATTGAMRRVRNRLDTSEVSRESGKRAVRLRLRGNVAAHSGGAGFHVSGETSRLSHCPI